MLILSTQRAAYAIGSSCTTLDGSGDPQLLESLLHMTSRVEAALEVRGLARKACTDTYDVVSFSRGLSGQRRGYRLSNMFLTDDPVTLSGMFDQYGEPITTPELVDKELGVVYASPYSIFGTVSVAYTSGFTVAADVSTDDDIHANPNYRPGLLVPDALCAIATEFLVRWQRAALLTPKAPKEYGFLPTITDELMRDLRARINNRYQRPRANLEFPLIGG